MTIVNKSHQAIGILGGTFDPIHLGHTKPAEKVAQWLGLDKIILLPANIPPHKAQPKASAEQRVTMVELVCKSESTLFKCDQRELHRSSKSYTIDTLQTFKQEYNERPLYFIIGMDSLLSFTQWHNYQEILTLCNIVVNTRPNFSLETLNDDTKTLLANHRVTTLSEFKQHSCGAIIFSPSVEYNISSTQLREQLKLAQDRLKNENNYNVLHLSPLVLDFINKNQLYR